MLESIVVFVTIAVVVVIIALYNRKQENRAVYDERQLMLRGNAYKYGFSVTLVLNAVGMFLTAYNPGLQEYAMAFLTVSFFAGVTVFAGYSIMKDAFFSVKNRSGYSYIILLLLVIVSQSASLLSNNETGGFLELLRSERIINFCCTLTFLIILLLIFVKKYTAKNEEDEEE